MKHSDADQTAKVDKLAESINGQKTDSTYTDLTKQIYTMMQDKHFSVANLQRLNDEVDMRKAGFPEDFTILGVNSDWTLKTKSFDGTKVENRDGKSWQVTSDYANNGSVEKWGNRFFQAKTDGTADYVVQSKDKLWNITEDALTGKLGRKPTNTEINDFYKQISAINNIKDANKLKPGQLLHIPGSAPIDKELQDKKSGSIDSSTTMERGENDYFNPVAAPGLPGTHSDWLMSSSSSTELLTSPGEDGGAVRTKVSGQLDGYYGDDQKFSAVQITDKNGKLISNDVTYSNNDYFKGVDMYFDTDKGKSSYIEGVSEVKTYLNALTGNYETTISATDGTYKSVTNSDGKVLSFKSV